MVAVELPEESSIKPEDIMGVDMGIANIAVDSTGKYYSGDHIWDVRDHNADLHSILQAVGNNHANRKSAGRHLKKLSGKESRFARNTNHVISKEIVKEAKGTSSAIALEKLEGIRMRTTVRKGNRYIHNSWSFHQIRLFMEYRARPIAAGAILDHPDPPAASSDTLVRGS